MNLLAEDLIAEIMVTIDATGEPRVYYSKMDSMNKVGLIASVLVDAGMKLAADHAITLTVGGPEGQRIEFPPPRVAAPRAVTPAGAAGPNPFPEIQG